MLSFPNVETVSDEKADQIFNLFNPSHPPAGLQFSKTFRAFTIGLFKKEYYILELTTGDVDDGTSYLVDEWCDKFYKFSSKSDMEMAMACFYSTLQAAKSKGKMTRFSIEKKNKSEYKEADYQHFMKQFNCSLA